MLQTIIPHKDGGTTGVYRDPTIGMTNNDVQNKNTDENNEEPIICVNTNTGGRGGEAGGKDKKITILGLLLLFIYFYPPTDGFKYSKL